MARKLGLVAVVVLMACLRLNGQVVALPELAKPENIVVDGNQILITQFPKVFVYSEQDFRLLCQFGKAGEGPTEFHRYVRIQYIPEEPDFIVVGSHMKMTYFTRTGEYVKEIRSKTSTNANVYKPLGNRFVAYGFAESDGKIFTTVNLFDADLKKIREVHRWQSAFQRNDRIDPTDTDLAGGEFKIYLGRIYILLRREGVILEFDGEGRRQREIRHKFQAEPFTVDHRRAFDEFYRTDPRYKPMYEQFFQKVDYPSRFPRTREMYLADDCLYILTWNRQKENSRFSLFSLDGTFLQDAWVPVAHRNPREACPFTVKGQRLYQLIDNADTEEWELHIHGIH